MKKIAIPLFLLLATTAIHAQSLNKLLKNITRDSAGKKGNKTILSNPFGTTGDSLTTSDVISGLKEALNKGATNGTVQLSALDGFFKNAAIKILMPPEAQKVEKTLRNIGLGKQVDDAVLSMNRAAEDAAKSAAPIFLNAIKQMTFADAWSILRGGDSSATHYLREKTTVALTDAFKPVIDQSLNKVGATKYWNTVFTTYNKFTFDKVNPDLSGYVTDKALSGIFYEIALQETQIRKDPLARTSDILKKVFGK